MVNLEPHAYEASWVSEGIIRTTRKCDDPKLIEAFMHEFCCLFHLLDESAFLVTGASAGQ